MAQINLDKVTNARNAPAGKLGIFVTPDNEAFLVDENGAVYAFGGGATNLLALSDFPNSFAGQALKAIRVNAGANAVEFVDFPAGFDGNPSSLNQEGATDGQAIVWNNTEGKWEPATVSGSGGVQSVTGDGVNNTDPDNPVISLAAVAVSGDYDDLDNKPSLAFVETVTGLNVDITDPLNPIIEYPEGVVLTTNTVVFNTDNVSGITTARTGDVLVDLTNAKVYGTFTMIHNDASAFGFFETDGTTPFVFYQSNPDDYVAGQDNILDFHFIGDGKVRLTISQPD
jgi:hypothetical protein